MAQIDEERILVRFSKLIRDTANVTDSTVVTTSIVNAMEAFAQDFVTEDILVEASIYTGNLEL